MTYSRIAGTGGYLPERVLTNAELEKMVDRVSSDNIKKAANKYLNEKQYIDALLMPEAGAAEGEGKKAEKAEKAPAKKDEAKKAKKAEKAPAKKAG